jgi:hypothetical protein
MAIMGIIISTCMVYAWYFASTVLHSVFISLRDEVLLSCLVLGGLLVDVGRCL